MIEIKVPATSANIGPGFDCLGIALNMYNRFYIEEIECGLEIWGCDKAYSNENNLVYTSMQKCFEIIGHTQVKSGIKIQIKGHVPVSRGLGSSATCILAGVMAANELSNGNLSKNDILEICSEIEGHPDNITPALFGGMTASIKEGSKIYFEKIKLPYGIKFCSIIPDFTLSTKKAREVLPDNIPYKDGTFNVGRVSLLIAALINGDFDMLRIACKDKLHQTYRANLIDNFNEILNKSNSSNSLCTFLSGAGPTIMVILREEETDYLKHMESFLGQLKNKWVIKELKLDVNGTLVKNI